MIFTGEKQPKRASSLHGKLLLLRYMYDNIAHHPAKNTWQKLPWDDVDTFSSDEDVYSYERGEWLFSECLASVLA